MNCSIPEEKHVKIRAWIAQSLKQLIADKSNPAFNLQGLVNTFYSSVVKHNNNPELTAQLAQTLPRNLEATLNNLSVNGEQDLVDQLMDRGLDREIIRDTTLSFERDIDNVIKYIKGDDLKAIKAIEANMVTNSGNQEEVIDSKQNILEKDLASAITSIKDEFIAQSLNFNASTDLEAPQDRSKPDYNVPYENKKPMFRSLRGILNEMQLLGLDSAETLEYGGHRGFRLLATANTESETQTEGFKYKLTIVDNNGYPIKFNQDGTVANGDSGQVMFQHLREYNKDKEDALRRDFRLKYESLIRSQAATRDDISSAEIAKAVDVMLKKFTDARDAQIKLTNDIIQIINKPGAKVLLDITGGSLGYIHIPNKAVPLAPIWNNLEESEKKITILNVKNTGSPYIRIKNYDKLVELRAGEIGLTPSIAKNIIDILTKPVTLNGKPLNNNEKVNYVKTFIYSDVKRQKAPFAISIDPNSGDILLMIHGEVIDVKTPEGAAKLEQMLLSPEEKKTVYLQVNNESLQKGTYLSYNVRPDNSIEESNRSYIDLLLPSLHVYATPNAQNKIVSLNPYFTWAPTTEVVEEMVVDNQKAEKKEEVKKPGYDVELEMTKLIEQRATPAQRIAAKKWWESSPLSKHIKLNVLTNIVNSDAWATWNTAGITLFKGSDYTTTYHEAWHAFSQLYLSKDEKRKLYQEVSNQDGSFKVALRELDSTGNQFIKMVDVKFKDATPRQLEEYIAEEFRNYGMSGGKSFVTQPVRKNIFQKIWAFLKQLFTGVDPVDVITQPHSIKVLSDVFNNLYVGNINKYSPSVDNILFDSANSGVINAEDETKSLSYAESMKMVRAIDGLAAEWIRFHPSVSYASVNSFSKKKNRLTMFDSVKTQIINKRDLINKEIETNDSLPLTHAGKWDIETRITKVNTVDTLTNAINNWGDPTDTKENTGMMGFYKDHSVFSEQMLEIPKEEEELDVDGDSEEDLSKGMRFHTSANNEKSSKDLADAQVLFLTKSLLKVDDSGALIPDEWGFPQLAPFNTVWNSMIIKLGVSSSPGEVYNKILAASITDKVYEQLRDKLGDPARQMRSVEEENIWLKFWQIMSMPRIPIVSFIGEKDKSGNISAKVGKASASYHKVLAQWESDFRTNPGIDFYSKYIIKGTGDNEGTNYLNLENIKIDFLNEVKAKGNSKERKSYTIKPGQEFKFLQSIGINLSDIREIRNELRTNEGIALVNQIADAIGLLANNRQVKISNPIEYLSITNRNGIGISSQSNRDIPGIKVESLGGRITELAELESTYSNEYSSLSVVTPDGKLQYEQALGNSMTSIADAINKAQKYQDLYPNEAGYINPVFQHMERFDFKNNPAARTSILLNSIFELDVDPANPNWGKKRNNAPTLDMYNLGGATFLNLMDYSDQGVAHSGMTISDKFITDLNTTMSAGYFPLPQHGSKQTYLSPRVSKIVTTQGKKESHLYIDTKDFLPWAGNKVQGMAEGYKIVKKYLQSEIQKIQMVKSDPTFYNKIRGFENAGEFSLFSDNILTPDLKAFLLSDAFLTTLNKHAKNNFNNDFISAALAEYPKVSRELEEGYVYYFNNLAANYTDNYLTKLTAVYDNTGKFLYDGIQHGVYEKLLQTEGRSEEEINNILRRNPDKSYVNADQVAVYRNAIMKSFAVNSWINKVEMMTIFYGDPAQYNHAKEEFNKRNSVFASGGYMYAVDEISSNWINNKKNHSRDYSATIEGAKLKQYNGTLDSAIIADNNVKSVYFDSLNDMFRKGLVAEGITDEMKIREVLYGKDKSGEIGSYNPKTGDTEKVFGGKMSPFTKMTEGDGQGMVSFDAYRILKRLEGKWSDKQDQAYRAIIAGKRFSLDEISELFPVYKVQYAGPLKSPRPGIPTLSINAIHKFSLFPLIPTSIENTPMEGIHKQMIKEGVDYVVFQSGSKLSSVTSNNDRKADVIFKNNDTTKLELTPNANGEVFTKNTIFLRYLKNQLDLNTEYKKKTILSTQLRGLLTSGLIENGLPVDYMKGEKFDVRKAAWNKMTEAQQMKASPLFAKARTFENNVSKLVRLGMEKLVEDLGWTWTSKDLKTRKPTGPMAPMVKFIRQELRAQGFAEHEIDYVNVNDKGELVRDLSVWSAAPKVERMLMAIVNKRIVKQHMQGESLVQVAVSFTNNYKWQKPTDEQKKLYEFGTGGLPFYTLNKDGSVRACKIKIALQGDFERLLNTVYLKKDETGKYVEDGTIAVYDDKVVSVKGKDEVKKVLNTQASLDKLNEMLRVEEWLNRDNNRKKIRLTGVRIPVQGLNSMEFMEVYEFLPPETGPIIILPSEIVAKSGGDFDVDKLTTYFPHINKAGEWVNGEDYDGLNWKEDIDKDLANIDEELQKKFGKILGEKATLNNIKKKLKGDKTDNYNARLILKNQKKLLQAKKIELIDEIKSELSRLSDLHEVSVDLYKKVKDNDDEGLIKALDLHEELNILRKKGKAIHNAYKELKTVDVELVGIKKIIDENYLNDEALDALPEDPEFDKLLKQYTALKNYKKNYIKAVGNNLIDSIIDILSLKENAVQLLTPNDVHLTKPIADKMQDMVQDFDFKKSRSKDGENAPKGVWASRTLEEDYNWKKHQDNITGKGGLGIVAIENKYHPIFNASGAYIEPTFTHPFDTVYNKETGEKDPITVPTTIRLKANYIVDDKGQKVISLSNLKDSNNEHPIGEIYSQLVNGFVDVEKDAWVAYIQGNIETIPMLQFLIKTGVPIRDAIMFVSNPLIRMYVQEQKSLKGVLGELIGKSSDKTGIKSKAANAVWKFAGQGQYAPKIDGLYNAMGNTPLDLTKLEEIAHLKLSAAKTNPEAISAFAHFLYLEDVAQGYNDIKAGTNADTKKTATLYDSELRSVVVDELLQSKNYPKSIVEYIKDKSSISGFVSALGFGTDLYSDLFTLRNNKAINTFLRRVLTDYSLKESIKKDTGYEKERLINEFKNYLVPYLFINEAKTFEVGGKNYKGLPVTYAEGIDKSAYVIDNKVFINIKNIEKEFSDRSYLSSAVDPRAYSKQGLATLKPATITSEKEYQNFVVEREYLRSSLSIKDVLANPEFRDEVSALKILNRKLEDETGDQYDARIHKMAYENYLRDTALDNIFNFFKMFKAEDKSYPKRMMELIKKYPHLKSRFSVLNQFAIKSLDKKAGTFNSSHINLLLKDARDLDQDSTTQYYNDIKALSSPESKLIKGDSREVIEENNFINDFFKKLSYFALIQGGLTSGTPTAFTSIVPYEDYSTIVSRGAEKMKRNLSAKRITESEYKERSSEKNKYKYITHKDGDKYYSIDIGILDKVLREFVSSSKISNKAARIGGRDLLAKTTPKFLKEEEVDMPGLVGEESEFVSRTSTPGVFILSGTRYETKYEGAKEVKVPINITPKELATLEMINKDAVFIKKDSKLNSSDPAVVNAEIEYLEGLLKAGTKLVFREGGYGQDLLQQSQMNAPEVVTQAPGVEISSTSKGLGAALTNPTELAKSKGNITQSYPVTYKGTAYKDVEEAYQKLKDKSEITAKPAQKDSGNYKLMVNLLTTKLKQYPRLVEEINKKGGSPWILSSTHQPTKGNTVWETGGQNWFIKALNEAYTFIQKPVRSQPIRKVKPTINLAREWKGDLESRPVYTKEGVNTMRTTDAKPNEHFGNPFSESGYGNTIKVDSIGEAVDAYKTWLLMEEDMSSPFYEKYLNNIPGKKYNNILAQRDWIIDQINQGKLDSVTLLYAGKSAARGQGMHPTALAEVVEQLRTAQSSPAVKSDTFIQLSQQLVQKFGYVNPGSEKQVSILDILSKRQIINQEEIDKREQECKNKLS